jgi:hypothetical protein
MNIEEIKKLSNKELLEIEHDTQVDILDDLSGSLYLYELHDKFLIEIEIRKLEILTRLNGLG